MSVVLAVAAALGVGVGGYFVLAGDCSSCETETTAAAATPVAGELGLDSCCPTEGAVVETVANVTSECDAKADCDAATECETKTDCEAATDCKAKTDCETATECDEKTECEEGEVCPVTGKPVELTSNDD